jgi:hypothetical protein
VISHARARRLLETYRGDCKEQKLSLECAMATALMSVIAFHDAFENGPRQRWSARWGQARADLRNLQCALDVEFEQTIVAPSIENLR